MNGVLERYWSMREAAALLGVGERQGTDPQDPGPGAAQRHSRDHPATSGGSGPRTLRGINHTQLTELLAEREGVVLSRPTVIPILFMSSLNGQWFDKPVLSVTEGVPRNCRISSQFLAVESPRKGVRVLTTNGEKAFRSPSALS